MYISKLTCTKCTYTSDTFSETKNFDNDSYSFVFQNELNREIVVRDIPCDRVNQMNVDIDSEEEIVLNFALKHEKIVKIPLIDNNISVKAKCPKCAQGLIKIISGYL